MSLDNLKIRLTNIRIIEGNSTWGINRTIHISSDFDFNNINGFYKDEVTARCDLNIQKQHVPTSYCMHINIFNQGSNVVTLQYIKIYIDKVFVDNTWKVSERMFIFPGQSINIPFAVKPVLQSGLSSDLYNTLNITIIAFDKKSKSIEYNTSISNDHPDYQSPNSAVSLWKDNKNVEKNIKNGSEYVIEENIRQMGQYHLKNRKNVIIASASLVASTNSSNNVQASTNNGYLTEVEIQEVGPIITFKSTSVIESTYVYNLSGDTRKTTLDVDGATRHGVIYTLHATKTGPSISDKSYTKIDISFETRGISYDKKIWYEVWHLEGPNEGPNTDPNEDSLNKRASKMVDNRAYNDSFIPNANQEGIDTSSDRGDPDRPSGISIIGKSKGKKLNLVLPDLSGSPLSSAPTWRLLYKDTFITNNNNRKYTKSYKVDITIGTDTSEDDTSPFLLKVFWNKQVWNISSNTITTTSEINSLSQYADQMELVNESATRLYSKFNDPNHYFETPTTSLNGEFGKSINEEVHKMFSDGLILEQPLYIIRYVGLVGGGLVPKGDDLLPLKQSPSGKSNTITNACYTNTTDNNSMITFSTSFADL